MGRDDDPFVVPKRFESDSFEKSFFDYCISSDRLPLSLMTRERPLSVPIDTTDG